MLEKLRSRPAPTSVIALPFVAFVVSSSSILSSETLGIPALSFRQAKDLLGVEGASRLVVQDLARQLQRLQRAKIQEGHSLGGVCRHLACSILLLLLVLLQ